MQDKNQSAKKTGREATEGSKDYSLSIYSSLLKNEILGAQIEDFKESSDARGMPLQPSENRNLFSYRPKRQNIVNEVTSPYSLTPVSSKSQKLLRSPRKASRKISKIPFKVLDAPELQVKITPDPMPPWLVELVKAPINGNLCLFKPNQGGKLVADVLDQQTFEPGEWGSRVR